MIKKLWPTKLIAKSVLKILGGSLTLTIFLTSVLTSYLAGYKGGHSVAYSEAEAQIEALLSEKVSTVATIEKGESDPVIATPKPVVAKKSTLSGPDLWQAVNKRRLELGVNGLSTKEELCTIASIRLNQLLELGKLDGHEGFSKLPEERSDLKWIFEKYNLSEFLVSGAESSQEAVALWENSLGHKQLLSGGEYVWGCIYAQNGFGVAIAAY